ncbi:MAG: hypothetical protein LM558_00510 [Thermosphaera sp.]|nr:hypothetical protein [Thermosphaera sp.]
MPLFGSKKELRKKIKIKIDSLKPVEAPVSYRLYNLFLSTFGANGVPVSFFLSLPPSARIDVNHVVGKMTYSSFITRGKKPLSDGFDLRAFIYPILNESLFKMGTQILTVALGWDDPAVMIQQLPTQMLHTRLDALFEKAKIKYKPGPMESYLPSNKIIEGFIKEAVQTDREYPVATFFTDNENGKSISDAKYEVLAVICDNYLSTLIYAVNLRMLNVFSRKTIELPEREEGELKLTPQSVKQEGSKA